MLLFEIFEIPFHVHVFDVHITNHRPARLNILKMAASEEVPEKDRAIEVGYAWTVLWAKNKFEVDVELFDSWDAAKAKVDELYPQFETQWKRLGRLLHGALDLNQEYADLKSGDELIVSSEVVSTCLANLLELRRRPIMGISARKTKRLRED